MNISFERAEKIDTYEQVGNACFCLLHVAFGKSVKVTKSPYGSNFENKAYSTPARISAFALALFTFPLTFISALAGAAAYAKSASRLEIIKVYKNVEEWDNNQKETLKKISVIKDALLKAPSFPTQKYCDTLATHISLYSKVKVDGVTEESMNQSLKDLEEAITQNINRKNIIGPDEKLIDAKTKYLKMRDIAKFNKHQGQGIPNPSTEIPLSSKESIKALELPAAQKPLTEVPQYLFKYHHPSDSAEESCLGYLGMSSQDPKWKNTLDYVNQNVLQKPLQKLTREELFKLITTLHSLIINEEEPVRNRFSMVINPDICEANFPSMKEHLKTLENGEVLVKRLNRLEQKVNRWSSFEEAAPYITPKEWETFSKVVFLPPSPNGLQDKTNDFLQKAIEVMNNPDYHPYQVAAYLHQGLTVLHLFKDGNGRLSRLMANIYLMQNGFKPFYVVSDRVYTAINHENVYDVAFCQFLKRNYGLMEQLETVQKDDDVNCVVQ